MRELDEIIVSWDRLDCAALDSCMPVSKDGFIEGEGLDFDVVISKRRGPLGELVNGMIAMMGLKLAVVSDLDKSLIAILAVCVVAPFKVSFFTGKIDSLVLDIVEKEAGESFINCEKLALLEAQEPSVGSVISKFRNIGLLGEEEQERIYFKHPIVKKFRLFSREEQ